MSLYHYIVVLGPWTWCHFIAHVSTTCFQLLFKNTIQKEQCTLLWAQSQVHEDSSLWVVSWKKAASQRQATCLVSFRVCSIKTSIKLVKTGAQVEWWIGPSEPCKGQFLKRTNTPKTVSSLAPTFGDTRSKLKDSSHSSYSYHAFLHIFTIITTTITLSLSL